MSLRIDAHNHLWDLSQTPQPWIDEALEAIDRSFLPADLVGVAAGRADRTVVVQTVTDAAETPLLLEYAVATELIGAVVGWVDLTGADVAERLAALADGPGGGWLRGIRHQVQGEADPLWLARPDVRRGLEAVGEAGLVYELLTLPHQMESAVETVRALPGVSFVIDHMSKPSIAVGELEPWAGELRRLAESPNVTCKLSGMVTEADWDDWTLDDLRPFSDTVLDAFGPDRVMFGSDWPVCLLAGSYESVWEAARALTGGLDRGERDAVFGGTAARVFAMGEDR